MKYVFIGDHRHEYRVSLMGRVLQVSRSGSIRRFWMILQTDLPQEIFTEVAQLQSDLDNRIAFYHRERTHQGKRCQGKTPMQTFDDGLALARKANLESEWMEKLTA